MSHIITECESTISIPIDRQSWECHLNNPNIKSDVIFLIKLNNSGDSTMRLHERNLEIKTTLSRKYIFGLCPVTFVQYPILRTTANESRTNLTKDEYMIVKSIHRLFIHEDGVRVSFNKDETNDGERFYIEYEIEYSQQTTYREILGYEEKLMSVANKYPYKVNTSVMALETIFSCVMNKVQMWHCFDDTKDYLWAYKWNGVKGKLMFIDDERVYLWPDAGNVVCLKYTIEGPDAELVMNLMKYLCLLVEIMNDKFVMLEVIGGEFINKTYTLEPQSNINFLNLLHTLSFKINIHKESENLTLKPLIIQNFFKPPMDINFSTNNDEYDGLILIQMDLIIKWKLPTVDVMCIMDNTYSVGDGIILTLSHMGLNGAIYEMSSSREIIRRRTDRVASSNQQEYNVFLKSTSFLSTSDDNNEQTY